MRNKYLNDSSKHFYTEAFEHAVNCGVDKFLIIEKNIYSNLKKINRSKDFRTMLSRSKYQDFREPTDTSYLFFCYTVNGESLLMDNIIPFFEDEFKEFRFTFSRRDPIPGQINSTEQDYCLKFLKHQDYYNINHVEFHLKDGGIQDHIKFWRLLEENLQ